MEIANVESALFEEILDREMTRDDVALTYAFGLRSVEPIDWLAVNRAIIARWSKSALKYIKEQAWKRIA